jgi:hypothetical protein
MLKNLVLLHGGCSPNRFLLPLSAIPPKQEARRRIANPRRRAATVEACNMTIMSRTPYWYNLSGSLISLTTADGAEKLSHQKSVAFLLTLVALELSAALKTRIQVIRNLNYLVFEITDHFTVLILLL